MCRFKEKCGKVVFDNCQLKRKDFKKILDAHNFYEGAIRSLNDKIQSMIEAQDETKVIGGLLFCREQEILHCFFEAPGDLPSAVSTANSYINQDISMMDISDIKPNEVAEKIWNLVVLKGSILYQADTTQKWRCGLLCKQRGSGRTRRTSEQSDVLSRKDE